MPLRPDISLRDLAPEDAAMALDVLRFAEQETGASLRGGRFLVALSGGADSTALLVLACALRDHAGFSLAAAHLDHALREESAAEAEAAGRLCAALGVPFVSRREDVALLARECHCGIEEAGRRARYAFLEETRLAMGADYVLTAHHAGDLAEDMLMRLTRGAGWPGLGGMKAVVDESPAQGVPGRRVLRPLLMQEKDRLIAMLVRLGVGWQEDASNASREWKRNRVRHDLMPLLLAENLSFHECVRRLWRQARDDEDWWTGALGDAIAFFGEGEDRKAVVVPDSLASLGRAGRKRAFVEAVRRMGGQARADTVEAMEEAWTRRHFPRRFSFGGGVKAAMDADGVSFFRAEGR